MKKLTAIAISGGIDSLVAAYLLKQQGHNLIGIHFITGYETNKSLQNITTAFPDSNRNQLSTADEKAPHKIISIAHKLGINIKIIDCSLDFKNKVVDYFTQSYQIGRTPNPCLACNPSIKFGSVLAFARKLGASCLATGHYARILKNHKGKFHLLKGIDHNKDQSYFLAFLSQEQLAYACFPLGSMKKTDVAKLAIKKGYNHIVNRESQDICFIKDKTYGEFLALQQGFKPKPGLIENVNGNILGEHKGLHLFTIGQRRGINCPGSEPYYVVKINQKQNRLVVGCKKDLISSKCRVVNINWIANTPASPIAIHTRVRYRHKTALCTLVPGDNNTATVEFENPQEAITPGQGAVFYQGNEVLGGGWIAEK
ncbi:MAG: tRNA 2-thiouridine(34) synthase MnmA [Deltaproteobacteria bacterium]|nr:tRNA 2-thiouridine(34) synthase MnmA [Deltaproteobacteria bacterium]